MSPRGGRRKGAGRPAVPEGERRVRIAVTVPPETFQSLEERGGNRSAYVAGLIAKDMDTSYMVALRAWREGCTVHAGLRFATLGEWTAHGWTLASVDDLRHEGVVLRTFEDDATAQDVLKLIQLTEEGKS